MSAPGETLADRRIEDLDARCERLRARILSWPPGSRGEVQGLLILALALLAVALLVAADRLEKRILLLRHELRLEGEHYHAAWTRREAARHRSD